MTRLLPSLELDLRIEHDGHQLSLTGSRMRFCANFPTLLSAVHFVRMFWPSRRFLPANASVRVQWRWVSILIA